MDWKIWLWKIWKKKKNWLWWFILNRRRIYVFSELNPLLALEGAQSMPYEEIKVTSYLVRFPTASGANAQMQIEIR